MEISVIHFVLDSFRHFMPKEGVEDFVRMLVGKKVILIPNDGNEMDKYCIEGWFAGAPCCHVSGRKSQMVREAMVQCGTESFIVEVKSHNLDKGYETVFCEIALERPIDDKFIDEHIRRYMEWEYCGKVFAPTIVQRKLMANTQYLLNRLGADDATEDEVIPVVDAYLSVLHVALSIEDKENNIKVNILIQNSQLQRVRDFNRVLVEKLDYLNHTEIRANFVRQWIRDMKDSKMCRNEVMRLKEADLDVLTDCLNAFPEDLFYKYETDFVTFCGNLFYNNIPGRKLQEFISGVALCESIKERLARMSHVAAYPTCIDQLDDVLQACFTMKDRFAEISKLLNETIKPMVDATCSKANWDYVCYAFKVLNIVSRNLSREKFAQLLVAMCPDLGTASALESSMEKSDVSYRGKYNYEELDEGCQLKINAKPYIDALKAVLL